VASRRKKKNVISKDIQPGPASSATIRDPVTPVVATEANTPAVFVKAFKDAMEKAAAWPTTGLASVEKIKPMAFFVYKDSTMKGVSLSFSDELHKESLIHRIREKARAENACVVITLTEENHEKNMVVLSGVSPGMKASAYVDYDLEFESKKVTSWKIRWLDQFVQDVFLDSIFDAR
jgi:hypothetical protein